MVCQQAGGYVHDDLVGKQRERKCLVHDLRRTVQKTIDDACMHRQIAARRDFAKDVLMNQG